MLLALASGILASTLTNPLVDVHAAGGFEYSLSSSGGIEVSPGANASTTIAATLVGGTPSNVTLICDLSNLPPEFSGTACSFSPAAITPTFQGNATTILTIHVPSSGFYSAYNITVTASTGSQAPIAPLAVALTVGAKIFVNPTASGDLSYAIGTPLTVDVNVSYSPPFGGYIVALFFNFSVLQFSQLQYSGNGYVFGSDPNQIYLSNECLNKADIPGGSVPCVPDIRFDAPGVLSLYIATNGGLNTTTPTGILFSASFVVAATGFSAIHIVHQEVNIQPNGIALNSVGYDGYFTNRNCGSALCKPPLVSFVPPVRPIQYRLVTLKGTATSQNPNGLIKEYNWTAGSGLDITRYDSPTPGKPIQPDANFTFLNIGEHEVTLSAQDNFGARAYLTITVFVFRVWTDLGLSNINIDNSEGVLPGTVVHIVTYAFNNGVNPENSTIRIAIDGKNLTAQPVLNLLPDKKAYLNYTWQTKTNLSPRVYRIDVNLDEVRDPANGHILENDTFLIQGRQVDPNNHGIAFVQIITPVPGNFGLFLGLNLPETLGLGIVVVAVAGFLFGIIKKARAPPPEPL